MFSSQVFQEHFINSFVSRKLLQQVPIEQNAQEAHGPDKTNLSGNVLLLLSVLLCGIICSLGLHYIIRCAFRRSASFMISDPISSPSTTRGSEEVNKGIKKKALKMFPVVNYSPEINLSGLGEECVICLSDFADGEQLRLLPKCNHGFHVRCIDKWLTQHMTCPKCRHCLVETCQKILGDCDEADHVAATPRESIDVRIAPLEPSFCFWPFVLPEAKVYKVYILSFPWHHKFIRLFFAFWAVSKLYSYAIYTANRPNTNNRNRHLPGKV